MAVAEMATSTGKYTAKKDIKKGDKAEPQKKGESGNKD
jgi:hypothetical protein